MSVDQATSRAFVALNLAEGTYCAGYKAGATGTTFVQLPRRTVEGAVLEALLVELELGADGTLLATSPAAAEPLATGSLLALVVSVLEANLAGRDVDHDEFRGLETELERALMAVRAARAGLGTAVGPDRPTTRRNSR